MAEKKENYAKYVKEMYWPKVSAKKQQELEYNKRHIRHVSLRKSAHEVETPGKSGIKKSPIRNGSSIVYDRPWRAAIGKGNSKGGGSILLGDKQSDFTG